MKKDVDALFIDYKGSKNKGNGSQMVLNVIYAKRNDISSRSVQRKGL